ncbi:MAG TPA: ABC transporter ATP-binding protein [Clostridiales bacterium]|nr:ABC transporter ATP-binding protein [Clostridiales bacterium]
MDKKKLFRVFASYYKPHYKLFFLDISCALIVALIDLFFPMMTREVVGTVLPSGRMNTFWLFVAVMLILYLIRTVLQYIVQYWGHVLGVRIEHDMRRDLFSHLQTLPFRFYDQNRTGHLMSRIVNDLFEIAELSHHGPEDLFLSAIMLVGSFFMLMSVEWRLALIVYLLIPVMIWFALKYRKNMNQAFREMRVKLADVNAQLESSISGVRVSKSFTNEEYEKEKFGAGNRRFRSSKYTAYKSMAVFHTGIEYFSNMLSVIVVAVGGYFIYRKWMEVADLLAFIMYVGVFLQPVRRLTNFMQQFESGITGVERFVEIMEVQPDIVDAPDARELKDVRGDIAFENVGFSYDGNEKVLQNINLSIPAGQTIALVGPSGGGKTTMCHLIPRFYEVMEGRITIDGRDIRDYTLKSLRQNIGLVQQDIFLFAGTIRDNIQYGRVGASDQEVEEAAKNADIHDFIMSLPDGYDTQVGERGLRLSGGQKQRISIARVFLKNPPVLLLDEATSALDNETEIRIQRALEQLSHGRTSLIIAHRLSTIKNADAILVLTEEGVVEQGTHEELMEKGGLYFDLYQAQFKDSVSEDDVMVWSEGQE